MLFVRGRLAGWRGRRVAGVFLYGRGVICRGLRGLAWSHPSGACLACAGRVLFVAGARDASFSFGGVGLAEERVPYWEMADKLRFRRLRGLDAP